MPVREAVLKMRSVWKQFVCLCAALCVPFSFAAAQETPDARQAEIEALLGEGVEIAALQPRGGDAAYAQAILQRDGQAAVAVFRETDGAWALEAQSLYCAAERYRSVCLDNTGKNDFSVSLYPADGSRGGSYFFQKIDGVWQTVAYESEGFSWYLQDEGCGIQYNDYAVYERLSGFWRFPLGGIDFSGMPQTVEEMRARLLTGDVARVALAQYETVPLREAPSADAAYACVLAEGATVRVLDTRGGWAQVSPGGDVSGWVPADRLEIGNQGYRFHYSGEMTANAIPVTIYAAPSDTAETRRVLTQWPTLYIVGWCGGAYSDVCDGVWALVYDRDGIGYVRLRSLCYGNG